ncbi:MAG: hypothetical protein H6891_06730 [Brucellaceae bacterium]|nr:hypothetical protein [Brucellaceae bacterium]
MDKDSSSEAALDLKENDSKSIQRRFILIAAAVCWKIKVLVDCRFFHP